MGAVWKDFSGEGGYEENWIDLAHHCHASLPGDVWRTLIAGRDLLWSRGANPTLEGDESS